MFYVVKHNVSMKSVPRNFFKTKLLTPLFNFVKHFFGMANPANLN